MSNLADVHTRVSTAVSTCAPTATQERRAQQLPMSPETMRAIRSTFQISWLLCRQFKLECNQTRVRDIRERMRKSVRDERRGKRTRKGCRNSLRLFASPHVTAGPNAKKYTISTVTPTPIPCTAKLPPSGNGVIVKEHHHPLVYQRIPAAPECKSCGDHSAHVLVCSKGT